MQAAKIQIGIILPAVSVKLLDFSTTSFAQSLLISCQIVRGADLLSIYPGASLMRLTRYAQFASSSLHKEVGNPHTLVHHNHDNSELNPQVSLSALTMLYH